MSKYAFGDIAINSTEKKKPEPVDKATYIGLEHLDSGCLTVRRFGADVAPIGDKLVMKRGDVLFGKRRAYQKKVAIAPFDGIFSAHGMVLRPKTEVIDKDFFPLFIASDYFLDAAIRISVGSLSPTINWSDLKVLEFSLPPLDEQRRLAQVLWAALDLKEAYQTMLARCDEMASSRFVEMFGDPIENTKKWTCVPLGENATLRNGRAYSQDELHSSGKYPVLRVGNFFSNRGWYYSDMELEADKYCDNGDLLYAWSASFGPRIWDGGKVIYHYHIWKIETKGSYNKLFLCKLLDFSTENMMRETHGIAMMHLTKSGMEQTRFILPPLALQNEFAAFIEQLDKSKVALQKSIEKLDNLIKTLLQEHLG